MDRRATVNVSIVVPTYREAENLPALVERIGSTLAETDLRAEIIIVDDNSRDGTEEVCRQLEQSFPACPVHLIVRTEERGLSSAVITGMRRARGDILVVMDADLSHPPEAIPALVAALDDPATDMVIGSRYVAGGGTADDWGLFRWLNSKAATLLARPFTSAKDPMAGFFALRRQSFNEAESRLDPIGYKIGLELLVKCGFRNVVEVPIMFANRFKGESKLSLKEQLNYLRHLKRLFDHRYAGWSHLFQFLAVGFTGMLVDVGAFALLLNVLATGAARALAIWVAMTWNFVLNRRITFSYARGGSLWRQYLGFCGSCLVGAAVNWSVTLTLCEVHPFFGTHKLIAAVLGALSGAVLNYLLCRYLVFRQRQATKHHVTEGKPERFQVAAACSSDSKSA
jgi:dolichol-phosphate mannosyltransferase